MRTIVKLTGWVLIVTLFFSMMANPKGTADLIVNVGTAAGEVALKVGDFVAQLSKRLREVSQ